MTITEYRERLAKIRRRIDARGARIGYDYESNTCLADEKNLSLLPHTPQKEIDECLQCSKKECINCQAGRDRGTAGASRTKPIAVTNVDTGEVTVYQKIADVRYALGINLVTLYKYLDSGMVYHSRYKKTKPHGYLFERKKEEV